MEQTRSETVWFEFRFDGSWICAFPTGWIILLERDWMEIVSNDINTDDVFIVRFWPIFKSIFNAEVNNEIVSFDWSLIWSAICFW